MLTAFTHIVSPGLDHCQLSFRERISIDIELARRQHAAYCEMLRRHGVTVIELSANRYYPDSVFVEDNAIVVDEIAVICRMGVESRRGEEIAIESGLGKYRKTVRIKSPATLEGGDVLQIGKRIFAGRTARTNSAGLGALSEILSPFGYEVIPVTVSGCLHLKSACTALDDTAIIANPRWFDPAPFRDINIIPVPEEEPEAANVLRINDVVCLVESFPKTIRLVKELGYRIDTLNISELLKAEAGLTCSSIIFNAASSD
jgi:dimethylargininase